MAHRRLASVVTCSIKARNVLDVDIERSVEKATWWRQRRRLALT